METFKYLGVTLDQCLTFGPHVQKARSCLGQNMVLTLYKSLVLPHIDLGDVLYDVASKEITNKLQLAQNAACRVILLCGKKDSTGKMHSDLKLLRLQGV